MKIKDASVLVTGGSRGLGRALALSLARQGGKVVVVARHAGDLESAAQQIRSEGHAAHAIVADVGDKSAIYSIVGEAAALTGPVDILVLNASTLGPVPLRLLLDTECEDLEQVLQVNLIGPFRLAKAIAVSMAVRGSGVIVGISSDAAVEVYSGWGAYGVSKAALDHMLRILAKEMEGSGVQILSIDPGEMNTQMHADAMPDADPAALADPQDVAERITDIIRNAGYFQNGSRIVASKVEVS